MTNYIPLYSGILIVLPLWQIAASGIGAVNDMTRIAERYIKDLFTDASSKSEGYADAMRFMDETIVNKDEFPRYRITERFNQMLRDMYKKYDPQADIAEVMLSVLDKTK